MNEMISPYERQPQGFRMEDPFACEVCVTANGIYILGGNDQLATPQAVSTELGREPGEPLEPYQTTELMLKLGYDVLGIGDFEDRALAEDPIGYWRQYFGGKPDSGFFADATDEFILDYSRDHLLPGLVLHDYPNYSCENRQLDDPEELVELVRNGYLLDVTVETGSDDLGHAVLIHAVEIEDGDKYLYVYEPSPHEGGSFGSHVDDFVNMWDKDQGIVAVRSAHYGAEATPQ